MVDLSRVMRCITIPSGFVIPHIQTHQEFHPLFFVNLWIFNNPVNKTGSTPDTKTTSQVMFSHHVTMD
jgi:hypothetical protein